MNKIHTNTAIDNHALLTLYNLFVEADKYVANKARDNCFKYTHTNINMVSQIPRPHMFSSHFFPKHILEYIDETALHKIQYICKIKGRTVNIYFVLNDYMYDTLKTQNIHFIDNYIRMMYMWIYTLSAFSNTTCSKTLSVYVYLTPFQKVLPDNQLITISTEHVNTAYTTHCKMNNEIVIYRQEEWFKVFVHETFHSFGLDFANMANTHTINKEMKRLFNVNTDFLLFESYCEFWARTINCMMYTYFQLEHKGNIKYENFEKTFRKHMDKESRHSLLQGLKILNFLGLDYKTVNKDYTHITNVKKTDKNTTAVTTCNYLYKENTAVFSYYIITSLLINNYCEFMYWCLCNNTSDNKFLEFKKTPGNINSYIEFIDLSRRDKNILKLVANIEKSFVDSHDNMDRNLRMTTLDIHNTIQHNCSCEIE